MKHMNDLWQPLQRPASTERGFTLVELMIAVMIISVLAVIAVPQYNRYVQRSHRVNAQMALLQAAHWLERAMTGAGVYPAAVPANLLIVDGNRYTMAYAPANGNSTYTLTATAGSLQDGDGCGNLTVDERGIKGRSGTQPIDECWSR